jgi:aryl-alcohol dehydrogenase-like predicted oxidoreductase
MEKRKLGNTGLEVSLLGYGAMELRGGDTRGGRTIEEDQVGQLLGAVLDAGINFIDTSVDYGLSEERIGRHLSPRRDEFYLATKCGCNPRRVGDKIVTQPHDWSRDNILRNIEGSLERLQTDHVDVLQLHGATVDQVRQYDCVKTLEEIRDQGMTRFIGHSSMLPDVMEFIDWGVFDTFQIPYSCLGPEHAEAVEKAGQAGAGVIVRGGIAKGGPDAARPREKFVDLFRAARLEELTSDEFPAGELILRYTIHHPQCDTVIVGTMDPQHLAANVRAVEEGPLPDELFEEVEKRVYRSLREESPDEL